MNEKIIFVAFKLLYWHFASYKWSQFRYTMHKLNSKKKVQNIYEVTKQTHAKAECWTRTTLTYCKHFISLISSLTYHLPLGQEILRFWWMLSSYCYVLYEKDNCRNNKRKYCFRYLVSWGSIRRRTKSMLIQLMQQTCDNLRNFDLIRY